MLKLHFLGTLSGTEPFENMHHCSWVLETQGGNYWFDAGENCSHSAHTMGVDIMRTVALFVSHPHIDHTGGLANILFCIQKFIKRNKTELLRNNTLEAFMPSRNPLYAAKLLAFGKTEPPFDFVINEHPVKDGELFNDPNVRVCACHNTHLKEDGTNGWHSYSYAIEADGKKIVFSGDVGAPAELDPIIDGCDILIMETGHHSVESVCEYALVRKIKQLRFIHHGRQIIENRQDCERIVAQYCENNDISIRILCDKTTEIL